MLHLNEQEVGEDKHKHLEELQANLSEHHKEVEELEEVSSELKADSVEEDESQMDDVAIDRELIEMENRSWLLLIGYPPDSRTACEGMSQTRLNGPWTLVIFISVHYLNTM